MPWQEFATKILEIIISWPPVVVVALVLLRNPLRQAVGRLSKIEGFGVSGSFGEGLARLEGEVEDLPTPTPPAGDTAPDAKYEGLVNLTQTAPGVVVVSAWMDVQHSLDTLYGEFVSSDGSRPNRMEIIPHSLVQPLREMRELRNSVVHRQVQPSPAEALAYLQRATEVAALLDQLASLNHSASQ